jgi:hypothetical protein
MEYPLLISSIQAVTLEGEQERTPGLFVMAEAELGPFIDFGPPAFFFGKLVDVSEEQVLSFKYATGIDVCFRGSSYSFEALELNGMFKLVRRS